MDTMSGLLMTVPKPTEMLNNMPEFQNLDKLLPPIFDLDIAVVRYGGEDEGESYQPHAHRSHCTHVVCGPDWFRSRTSTTPTT